MRASPVLLVVALVAPLAGCLSADAPEAAPMVPAGGAEAVAVPAGTVLERTFSGTILARAGASETVQYEGDPPFFCFQVPENTTTLAGHLIWDQPEPMGLEFHDPEMKVVADSSPDPLLPNTQTEGPIDLAVDVHYPGEWFAYAGPGAVGANIQWSLTLTWTLDRPATAAEVEPTREC